MSTGPTVSVGSSGGGGGSGVGAVGDKQYNEFVTGPGIPSPAGANLTGNSSLQRAFPERLGGNAFQQTNQVNSPTVFGQALQVPSKIAAQPLAIADSLTGHSLTNLFSTINQRAPVVGGAVGFAGDVLNRVFSLPQAMMNRNPTMVMKEIWNVGDSAVITGDFLEHHGLNRGLADNFKKNGAPILGMFGITGDNMTVGELKKELEDRGFLLDPTTGHQMDWSQWAKEVHSNPLGDFSMGHASVNESAITNEVLQFAWGMAEFAPLGWAAGGIRALRGVQLGAKAIKDAEEIGAAVNGVGEAARAAGATQPWFKSMIPKFGRMTGEVGDGLTNNLVETGVIKPAVNPFLQGVAELAAGDATAASGKSFAQFAKGVLKSAVLPDIKYTVGGTEKSLNLLQRYLVGQTRVRAGLAAGEWATQTLEDYKLAPGPVTALHDAFHEWMNNPILSDDALFSMAVAFKFPFKAAVKGVVGPPLRPLATAIGRTEAAFGQRALYLLEHDAKNGLGKGAIEKLGGREQAGRTLDRVAQQLAYEKFKNGMPDGIKQQLESIPEATKRMSWIHAHIEASARSMIRHGDISPHDLVRVLREQHENPVRSGTNDEGIRYSQRILEGFSTHLSNDTIINHVNAYNKATAAIMEPVTQMQTIVLGRASQLVTEELDLTIQQVEEEAAKRGGTVDAQFMRDALYSTPGLLDDIRLGDKYHKWFVDVMNPSHNKVYTSDEVLGALKNLKDLTEPRDKVWHEPNARDRTNPGPDPMVVPMQTPGSFSNGLGRSIHSAETAKRFVQEADAKVRILLKEKAAKAAAYGDMFSKRGNVKFSVSDENWKLATPQIMNHMKANEVAHFSSISAKNRFYSSGYDVPMPRFGIVAEDDAVGLASAARAVRTEFPGADIRLTPSIDNPGHFDIAASYHFGAQDKQGAIAKAVAESVPTIFDSSKPITPRAVNPITPVSKKVMDAKANEAAASMGLPADQVPAAAAILKTLAESHVRSNGGSAIDFLEGASFVKGGRRGTGALLQEGSSPLAPLSVAEAPVPPKAEVPKRVKSATQAVPEMMSRMTPGYGDSGFTYDPRTGQFVEPHGWAVAVIDDTYRLVDAGDQAAVQKAVTDVVSQFDTMVGGWVDPSGKWGIDPSIVVPTEAEARALGAKYRQQGIYNLDTGESIKLDQPTRATDIAKWRSDALDAAGVTPGATPLAPGMIRAYHYTSPGSLESVLKTGLDRKYAKGSTYGEPNQIWFSTKMPDRNLSHFVEVHLKPEELADGAPFLFDPRNADAVRRTPETIQAEIDRLHDTSANFSLRNDTVAPDRIVAHSQPWKDRYTYLVDNYGPDSAEGWAQYRKNDYFGFNKAEREAQPDFVRAVDEWRKQMAKAAPSLRLEQRNAGVIKGSTEFKTPVKAIIRGYQAADFSTFVHETAHYLRSSLHPEDQALLESSYGVTGGKWEKAHEEQFARDHERYLRDGHAPVPELVPIFAKIAQIMRTIYDRLKGSPLENRISPDVKRVLDRAYGKIDEPAAIDVGGVTVPTDIAPPIKFQAEDAASVQQREEMRNGIRDLTKEIGRTRGDIADMRLRLKALKGTKTTLDNSFLDYNPDGSPKAAPQEIARVAKYTNHIRENFPMFEVEAGPRLMNLYSPDENFIKNLMIENSATREALYSWGPVSRIHAALQGAVDALDYMTRPVRGRSESRDTVSRIYEVVRAMGGTVDETNSFLENVNNVLLNERYIGTKHEQVPMTRGMNAMGARQISAQAVSAFGSNESFVANVEKRYGGQGLERMWVMISEAYNPVIRNIQRKIDSGGKVNRFQRLIEGGYDQWHTNDKTSTLASGTHMLAKYIYPALRFTWNPLYHIYNMTEPDIIGLTQDGLRVSTGSGKSPYSEGTFQSVERGNPEAYQSLQQAQRKAEAMGLNPKQADLQQSLVRGATLDQTGVTFGLNSRRAKVIERQVDFSRPETIIEALKQFHADDPALIAARKRYGGTIDDAVRGLTEDIYGLDSKGAKKYIGDMVRQQGWTEHEFKQMQPLVTEIVNGMQKRFDDMYQIHVGNVNRSRIERVANSYWLFWPASYMLKANKWMFNVLTEGAGGFKTNLGGAWTLNQLANSYHTRYVQDPKFRKLVDDNADLEFALSMVLPIVPWSDGVSLNRLTRQVGGFVNLWPQYTNFDPADVTAWSAKMADIGPVYAIQLVQQINKDLGKDFNWPGGPFPQHSTNQHGPSQSAPGL